MISRRQLTEVGRINKPHGHAGEMSVSLTTCDLDPADIRFLIMDVDGIYVPFLVTGSRPRGSEAWLVTFEGIRSDEEAAVYTGYTVYALTSKLRELYPSDESDSDDIGADSLIGFSVKDENGLLGTVTDIDMSTINALFVVKDALSDRTLLIPIADEFIAGIDMETHTIHMSLPTGLLEL